MMQLGLVPPKGITLPREASASWSLAGLPSHVSLGCRASFSSDLHSLPEPRAPQLLAQTGSVIPHLQLLGSTTRGPCRVFVLWEPTRMGRTPTDAGNFGFPTRSSPSRGLLPALLRSRGCSGPRGRCSSPTSPPGHDRSPCAPAQLSGGCSPLP